VIGIEPEDIKQLDLEMSESVASKVDELIDRVLLELSNLGVKLKEKV